MAELDVTKLTNEQLMAIIGGKPMGKPRQLDAIDIAAQTPEVPSNLVSIGRGMSDLTQGIKQKYLNWTDPEAAKQYTQDVNAEIALYERGRQAGVKPVNQSESGYAITPGGAATGQVTRTRLAPQTGAGFDTGRFIGNTAPMMVMPPGLGLGGRLTAGAATGGAVGYSNFNPQNTEQGNLINTGTGTVLGGAFNAAVPYGVRAGTQLVQSVSNKAGELGRTLRTALTPDVSIINNIKISLQKSGIDFDSLAANLKKSLLDDAKNQLNMTGKLDPAMLARKLDIEAVAGPNMGMSGQISGNPALWTAERNLQKVEMNNPAVQRGEQATITQRLQSQDAATKNYAEKLAEQLKTRFGPYEKEPLFGVNPVEARPTTPLQASEAVIKAIKAKDALDNKAVGELYDAYRDFGMKDAPIPDARIADILGKIDDEVGISHLGADVTARIKQFGFLSGERTKLLTLNEADKLNRMLGANDPGFGPASRAIGMVKRALNESILDVPAPQASEALLAARKAASDRFTAQKAGVGVKRIFDDVAPDKFFELNVLRGSVRDVQALKESLAKTTNGGVAWNNMRAEVFDWAVNKSTSGGAKEFNGLNLKKALDEIGQDRLNVLFSRDELQKLMTLKRGSMAMTTEPPFAAPSRSNTTPQLMGEALRVGNKIPGLNLLTEPIHAEMASTQVQKQLAGALSGQGADTAARDQAQAALRLKLANILGRPNYGAVPPAALEQKR